MSSARTRLTLASVAVAFAAADTYVVVLALPDMMAGVGLSADQLQRAAPIISGFLLGYIAVLPLIGRIADVVGRTPVLVGALLLFAVGSLITAGAYDLSLVVTGRFLQGVGGGGLVPATLALVADLWPPSKRGLPAGRGRRSTGAWVGPRTAAWCCSARSGGLALHLLAEPRRRCRPGSTPPRAAATAVVCCCGLAGLHSARSHSDRAGSTR